LKASQVIIFLLIVLVVYGSINFYILRRTWQGLAAVPHLRWFFFGLLLFLILAYPLGRFLERILRNSLSSMVITIGAFYLALMLYLLLSAFVVDLLRLGQEFVRFFPRVVTANPSRAAEVTFFIAFGISLATVILGHINTLHPRLKKLEIHVDKPAGSLQELKIVLASDLHFGTVTGRASLERIVKGINRLDPDLVVLPGDVLDEDVSGEKAREMSAVVQSIRAPLGVFACTGNHDYYAGIENALENLRRAGVTVLQDEAVKVGGSFYLMGRKDPSALRWGEKRTPLPEILRACDPALPLILLDHQPLRLDEAAQNGIDLEISGHTHAGQLFPLDLINKLVWDLNWGYRQKESTHYYVSCGAGTWGPPVRTGSYPEIVQIRLVFTGGKST
jgi:predicted MPP superfamily phosphohydrolase